jgi:hypothetical protein
MTEMVHDPEKGMLAPCLTLNHEQLKALGFETLPVAGTRLEVTAVAVVTRSTTEDPDANGDIDYSHVELRLVELDCKEAAEPNAVKRREEKHSRFGAKKLAERDVGGTAEKGEFGAFNRRFGL